jgi:hypothetical protein
VIVVVPITPEVLTLGFPTESNLKPAGIVENVTFEGAVIK